MHVTLWPAEKDRFYHQTVSIGKIVLIVSAWEKNLRNHYKLLDYLMISLQSSNVWSWLHVQTCQGDFARCAWCRQLGSSRFKLTSSLAPIQIYDTITDSEKLSRLYLHCIRANNKKQAGNQLSKHRLPKMENDCARTNSPVIQICSFFCKGMDTTNSMNAPAFRVCPRWRLVVGGNPSGAFLWVCGCVVVCGRCVRVEGREGMGREGRGSGGRWWERREGERSGGVDGRRERRVELGGWRERDVQGLFGGRGGPDGISITFFF